MCPPVRSPCVIFGEACLLVVVHTYSADSLVDCSFDGRKALEKRFEDTQEVVKDDTVKYK